ncbi:hypothetical protein KRX19_02325 [Cardiobacteriaceae bacterium TAE3-ERU3]|nr:hypothetical protein [Cardiobacteriaceae bacterium TAE3-ERU3]
MPEWLAKKYPLSTQASSAKALSSWTATYQPELVCKKSDLSASSQQIGSKIVDARSHERFLGIIPEPRQGLQSGHIPTAINIPFISVLEHGHYKTKSELHELFTAQAINTNDNVYFYCGSGVTACIVLLAALEAGINKVSLYDGSWSEWGRI